MAFNPWWLRLVALVLAPLFVVIVASDARGRATWRQTWRNWVAFVFGPTRHFGTREESA